MTNKIRNIDKRKDKKIAKPTVVHFKKVKGYKVRVCFRATRCEKQITKAKEIKLRQINKKIDKLQKEINKLFK